MHIERLLREYESDRKAAEARAGKLEERLDVLEQLVAHLQGGTRLRKPITVPPRPKILEEFGFGL